MTRDELQQQLANANVQAFLRVIRAGESSQEDVAYRMMFGGSLFSDFTDHPRVKNTAAGLTSTAAGAYQFLERTWDGLVKQYSFPDFSPSTQDEACVALIAGRGALSDVLQGQFETALSKCAKEWASLPGSPYGQPTLPLVKAKAVYEQYGGQYAAVEVEAEQPPAPVEERVTPPEEKHMLPFLIPAITSLIGAAPDLIRIFGKGPISERNAVAAEKVVDVAKALTTSASGEEAVMKIQNDPALASRFRDEVAANMDQWLGMVTRLGSLDEESKQKAREFTLAQPRRDVFLGLSFIEILSLYVVTLTFGGGSAMVWLGDLSPDLKGAIVTMMIVGGFTTIISFWFGSSLGSLVKNPPKTGGNT